MKKASDMKISLVSVIAFILFFRAVSESVKNLVAIDVTKISSLILFLCLMCIFSGRKKLFVRSNSYLVYFLLILIGTIVGLFTFFVYELPILNVFISFFRYVTPLLLIIIFFNLTNHNNYRENLIRLITFTIIYVCIINIILFLSGEGFVEIQGAYRFKGVFSNPNVAGGYINFSIIISLSLLLTDLITKKTKIVLFFVIFALYFLLYFTGSLTSIFSNLLGVLFIFFQYSKRAFVVFIIILFSNIFWIYDLLLPRLSMVINLEDFTFNEGSSLQWRYHAWTEYFSLLDFGHFLTGFGVGFQRTVFSGFNVLNTNKFLAPGTHNDYIGILLDFGIIGFLFFLFFVYGLYKEIIVDENGRFFVAILIVLLISMFFDNYIDSFMFFVIASFYGVFLKIVSFRMMKCRLKET